MLEIGQCVALALLASWLAIIVILILGKTKIAQFVAISTIMALFIPFFWLSGEITELTISKVGGFKTNVEQASKYLAEIKEIRETLQPQVKALRDDMNYAKTFTKKIMQALDEAERVSFEINSLKEQIVAPKTGPPEKQ